MRATERSDDDPWRLFRCRNIPSPTLSSSKEDPDPINNSNPPHRPPPAVAVRFLIVTEICSPTEFSVTPQPLNDFTFPGGLECFRELKHPVPFREIESQDIRMTMACNIKDHELLLRCLRMISGVELIYLPRCCLWPKGFKNASEIRGNLLVRDGILMSRLMNCWRNWLRLYEMLSSHFNLNV
ncbi:uncharacterized protein A4U43_C02F20770 [Asparagus officinalis]|uniref:Uncharacterized protein n=1 Tax=Asparagus officinalis TaxID=4686 RepID=A0A5P1FJT4_ASPOF|nr:uncharacterized protein A4U43_C02F20770 [Asparagus officinalis]